MTPITGEPIKVRGLKGLFARGEYESCPQDHLTDCNNCIFPAPGQLCLREGFIADRTVAHTIIATFYAKPTGVVPFYIDLDNGGNLRAAGALLATWVGATDFAAINIGGRVYISPKLNGQAYPASFVYYLDVATMTLVKAAGAGPVAASTLTEPIAGHVDAGDHHVAVCFQSATGYLSPPSPIATITSSGALNIRVANIPLGPAGTTARVIVASRAFEDELFFVPGAVLSDNVTTTIDLDFYDTSLVASSDYLNDLLTEIPSCAAIKFYKGRLVFIGQRAYPDNTLISRVSSYESVNAVEGIIAVPTDSIANSCNTALVIRDILYIIKPNSIYGTQDNREEPFLWPVTNIDPGIGGYETGVSVFSSSLASSDILDSSFLCAKRGLILFNGSVNDVPLTWKITDIWKTLSAGDFSSMSIAHDTESKRVYIAVPWQSYILMMDYSNGLDAMTVQWSRWTIDLAVAPILTHVYAIVTITGGLPDEQKLVVACASTNTLTLDGTVKHDLGVRIDQYVVTGNIAIADSIVNQFTALTVNAKFLGTLDIVVHNQDRSRSVTPREFTSLTYYTGELLTRGINFVTEAIQTEFTNHDANSYFWLGGIDIYGVPMWIHR